MFRRTVCGIRLYERESPFSCIVKLHKVIICLVGNLPCTNFTRTHGLSSQSSTELWCVNAWCINNNVSMLTFLLLYYFNPQVRCHFYILNIKLFENSRWALVWSNIYSIHSIIWGCLVVSNKILAWLLCSDVCMLCNGIFCLHLYFSFFFFCLPELTIPFFFCDTLNFFTLDLIRKAEKR